MTFTGGKKVIVFIQQVLMKKIMAKRCCSAISNDS
jgi:hypothetical protein